jgi:hypothetical protein
MKKGGNDLEYDPNPSTRRITGRRSPTAAIAVGVLVVALIILHFMGYSGGNGSIGHSPTNMLKQLPPNFLNSEGQLNVSEVLSGANVPNGIIEKVVNEIGPTITIPSGKKVKEILTETLKKQNLVKKAENKAERIMRKSKSREQ